MAENERIITSGSKRSGKSIPSGHDSFCMKQRESAREWGGGGVGRGSCAKTRKKGIEHQKKRAEEGKKDSRKLCISWSGPSHTLPFD